MSFRGNAVKRQQPHLTRMCPAMHLKLSKRTCAESVFSFFAAASLKLAI